jgi:hypothetical protein
MTEQKAREKGLEFTGHYERSSDDIDIKISALRKQYPDCKFYVVTVPPNPLSRGYHGNGYSIYATPLYSILKAIAHCKEAISYHDDRVKGIQTEYYRKLAEENARNQNDIAELELYEDKKSEIIRG